MLHVGVEAVDKVISSTANDGSVPTPSSLLTQRKPILIFGLLLADAGNETEYVVQRPWPPQPVLLVALREVFAATHDDPLYVNHDEPL
jgi:hypothetical protein